MRRMNACYCYRDLTTREVKEIVIALRKSESSVYTGNDKDNLFFKDNCEIPEQDKTYEKFTVELNSIFKKYNINTCIRRIHFLAQIYHETDRLRTTKEYVTNASYAPYVGRGLMQLTWKSNYKLYKAYSGIDCVTNYEKIANNLKNAVDSAGWYWEQGKTLNNSKPGTWKAPNFNGIVGDAVSKEKASVVKTIVTYGSETTKYGVINFNLLADNDWIDTISWLVNGGGNGLEERRTYLKELKKIFNYEKCFNNS